MWDKELIEEFRSLLANGNWSACVRILGHTDPSPAQAAMLLKTARHCKKQMPRSFIQLPECNAVIERLRSICEPERNLPGKVKKKPSKKEILGEQADIIAMEVAQKEGRRKGRGTVARGWEQKPGDA